MNKKLARRAERYRDFVKARAEFKVTDVSEYLYKRIAGAVELQTCILCEKKILKKDLKAKRFCAMETNRSGKVYPNHFHHLFEDDLETKKPDAEAVLQTVYNNIFLKEFSDHKEFLEVEK